MPTFKSSFRSGLAVTFVRLLFVSILEEIKLTFDEEGIEIPYNQLTVNMKTDEETTKGNGNILGEN